MNRGQVIIVGVIAMAAVGLSTFYFTKKSNGEERIADVREFTSESGAQCVALFHPKGLALALSCDFKNAGPVPKPAAPIVEPPK